jgi:uncharacterized membrane protein
MFDSLRRNFLAGILAVVPIFITAWIGVLVFQLFSAMGTPIVNAIATWIDGYSPEAAELILNSWFQAILAVVIVVILLCWLGALTKAVIGRRILRAFDQMMGRIPLVQSIYGSARKLIESFQQAPKEQQRVVLIEFPSAEMKTIGLVTSTFRASDTGQELAAVYVPIVPTPVQGYLEIVPVEKLVWLDWSTNDAMQFIMSGGTVAPSNLRYAERNGRRPLAAPATASAPPASPAPAAAPAAAPGTGTGGEAA